MNKKTSYKTIADLLTDESFLCWCLSENCAEPGFWPAWMAAKQEHGTLAEHANQVLMVLLTMKKQKLSDYRVNASFERLFRKMDRLTKKMQPVILIG